MKLKAAKKPATAQSPNLPSDHAVAALKTLLAQVSAIKLREVRIECSAPSREMLIVAYVDVYQHSHMLVCAVKESDEPGNVMDALAELRYRAAELPAHATQVFIAPRVSPEAQALCNGCQAGFLDLEGNARLHLDDMFIRQRSSFAHSYEPMAVEREGDRLAGVA
jgi:hypothetical protein